jgi:homogentisate 1,2-dioxygenase
VGGESLEPIKYQSGFNNHFESEALAKTLPHGCNSPQKAPAGLYAEQINGAAFTAPRRTKKESSFWNAPPTLPRDVPPDPMRWAPLPRPKTSTDFVDGLVPMVSNGMIGRSGCQIYHYAFNKNMEKRFFYSSDGEFLILPQQGKLKIRTEMGPLDGSPGEMFVIPRGVKFQVDSADSDARGYVCENNGIPFELPSLGPIGANGLANPRDFLYPSAQYFQEKGSFELLNKFQGQLWSAPLDHNPLNVVAWHGNYAPYKYDLRLFNTMNTVSFDHPDPSIFTVLTSPSEIAGTANIDFVIFPPRWMVAENTFRPPYYHRNIMSEYMGLIYGAYDAKQEGFVPGGSSLHNCMTAHGPDSQTFQKASEQELNPAYMDNTLAFMWESRDLFIPSNYALNSSSLDKEYYQCWQELGDHFSDFNHLNQ